MLTHLAQTQVCAKIAKLAHRDVNKNGRRSNEKDHTDFELLMSLIDRNFSLDMCNILAVYGVGTDVPEGGRNWSKEAYDLYEYFGQSTETRNRKQLEPLKDTLGAFEQGVKLMGLCNFFSGKNAEKYRYRMFPLTYIQLSHLVNISKLAKTRRVLYLSGVTWKNSISTDDDEYDSIIVAPSCTANKKTEADTRRLGKIGDLALLCGDDADGTMFSVRAMVAHTLDVVDNTIDRRPMRKTIDWIERQWRPNFGDGGYLIHFEPKEPTGGGGGTKSEKNTLKIQLEDIKDPVLDLIDQHINSTANTAADKNILCLLAAMQMGPFKSVMRARRYFSGDLIFGDDTTGRLLNNVLSRLVRESDEGLQVQNLTHKRIKDVLSHENYDAVISDTAPQEIHDSDIIIIAVAPEQYQRLYATIINDEEDDNIDEWLVDVRDIVAHVRSNDNWVCTFGHVESSGNADPVDILLAKKLALNKILVEEYQHPTVPGQTSNNQVQHANLSDSSDNDDDDDLLGE